ncbi:hypothetical protein AYI70_g7789 [Smittium culicis]|uniref:Uncharacterized protein n=1 Tax=Smittium culicis TaxID=133412 RepID=A0A1R1XIX1_9FUNG|nr:hypothetical protein AYI70_g7789 [Smittium culicis]
MKKKARKSANRMGFVLKSTETEKTVSLESTALTTKNLPFETATATKTNDGDKKVAEAKKLEPNYGSGSSHTVSVRTISETDDYEESSDYESDSDGNKTLSEYSIMAGKARLGLIPQKEFLNYVSSVDRSPQGANVANMELDSIPPGDTGADTEMRQKQIKISYEKKSKKRLKSKNKIKTDKFLVLNVQDIKKDAVK